MASYALTVLTQPTEEPVTLARAKRHLRIDHDEEDSNITAAISGARKYAETHTSRYFLEQTVRMKLAGWPCDGVIRLEPFGPNEVTEIAGFTYLDVAGDEQTVDAADYQAEFSANPPEIAPAPNTVWPVVEYGRRWPVAIDLTVGAASAADLDERIGQAILLTLGYWDADRGDADLATAAASMGLPAGAKRLLDSVWTGAYA